MMRMNFSRVMRKLATTSAANRQTIIATVSPVLWSWAMARAELTNIASLRAELMNVAA